MLSREDNERLTRVGPGTIMGDLIRQYWMPILRSEQLSTGGRVRRVRLVGEDLVALRTRNGKLGLLGELCSHRGASLYFGRNEEAGLRCVYHGWQFAVDGQCIDMPNEPAESNFQHKVRHPAYPCAERGGIVWAYLGPITPPPPLPDLEWALVPHEQRFVSAFYQECNYLQALEGGVDPAHISFLHGVADGADDAARGALDKAAAGFALAAQLEKAPHIEVTDTSYGVLIAARRDAGEGTYYWRITQFHLPFHTMPPTDPKPDPLLHSHIWIPVDDEHLVNWCISWHPTRALTADEIAAIGAGLSIHIPSYAAATNAPYGDIRPLADRRNDYLIDWDAHRTSKFFGVPGVGVQDKAITESQQPLCDRTRERLGRADLAIIRVRERLLEAAVALQERGTPAPGLEPASFLIRPASLLLPKEVSWLEGAKDQLQARPATPPAAHS